MPAITVDGQRVEVAEGATILDACTQAGIETPTICWAPNLTPVNVCRVCVVELEGARSLVQVPGKEGESVRVAGWRGRGVRPALRLLTALGALARDTGALTIRFQPWASPAGDGDLTRACPLR